MEADDLLWLTLKGTAERRRDQSIIWSENVWWTVEGYHLEMGFFYYYYHQELKELVDLTSLGTVRQILLVLHDVINFICHCMSLPLLTMHIINTRRFCPLTSLTSYLPSTSLSHLFLSATCIFRSPIQPHLSPLRACLRPRHVTCATILLSLVTRSLWCGRTDHIPKHIRRCGKLSSSPAADSCWSRISMITLFISAVDWTENTSNPPPDGNSAEPLQNLRELIKFLYFINYFIEWKISWFLMICNNEIPYKLSFLPSLLFLCDGRRWRIFLNRPRRP